MSFGPRMNEIFDDKRVRLVAFAANTYAEALKDMQDIQIDNGIWQNETKQALQGLFSGPITEDDAVGFFVAHTMDYGVFLELANDRKYEILRPTAEKWSKCLLDYARSIYA